MNVRKFCFLQLFLIALALSANAERAQNFNFGWKFHRGPCPAAETASFDDAGWECVDLPHDYQILSPWDKNAPSAQGFNGIRTSHNPYSTSLLDLCDELGMMVVDEWTDAWTPNGDRMCSRTSFNALFPQSIPEWIRRDRNHPSVVMWSLGNELQRFANTSGFETDDWGCTTYRMLDVLVKRYDPTRKTTVAQYPAARDVLIWNDPRNRAENDPEPSALLVATEIASQNYFPDRYAGYKRRYPHLILFQSEAATESLLKAATVMDLKSSVGFAYWGAVGCGYDKGQTARAFTHDNCSAFWHPSHKQHIMKPLNDAANWGGDCEGGCFLFVEVYADHLVVHRRSSVWDLPMGPDWIVPIPAKGRGPFDFKLQAAKRSAPQFATEAAVTVKMCPQGHDLEGVGHRNEPCVYVTFPAARPVDGCRTFDYVVTAKVGGKPVSTKLLFAAGGLLPPDKFDRPTECLFSLKELPAGKDVTFEIVPRECFGAAGRALASAPLALPA